MKVIKPSYEVFSKDGLTPYQFLEKIGRTCYKSEDKITEDSAVKFVEGLFKRKHYAVLEHYYVHLVYKGDYREFIDQLNTFAIQNCGMLGGVVELLKYFQISHFHSDFIKFNHTLITAPFRAFIEILDLIEMDIPIKTLPLVGEMFYCIFKYFPELKYTIWNYTPHFKILKENDMVDFVIHNAMNDELKNEVKKHKTHTVKLMCDRGVSHELVRHRPCSFAQESTRYCNYTLGKFDQELTFIKPLFFEEGSDLYAKWLSAMNIAETHYFELIEKGAKPEEARSVLPNSLKTEIIVTATEKEWQHIFNLRVHGTTGRPHPQIKEVLKPYYEYLKEVTKGRIE